MSTFSMGRARSRALALFSAGAVVIGVLGAVPSATAAPADHDRAVAKQLPARALGAGRYVVLLREPGATRYDGGVAGLQATEVAPGKPFNAHSDRVADYQRYLTGKQNGLARRVGAEVLNRTTLASNGFTAQLTAQQATELSGDRAVLMLSKDTAYQMDTWNTPHFLGLEGERGSGTGGEWQRQGGVSTAGAGTVVGVLDSGIWPESASFSGSKLDRNPAGPFGLRRDGNDIFMQKADGGVFHGFCQPGEKWVSTDCNSKLVSARYYPDAFLASVKPQERDPHEIISARDGDGHGSHTASTAAGNFGVSATVEGRSFGKISGMAPSAKVAAYKVCFSDTDPDSGDCYTSSTLSAIDDAIADGVDVINYSISGATNTVVDAVEYAFLGAAAAGVFVATSAGNSGPGASTVAHNSPWLTTTAASTHANFENTVVLGNGQRYKGASISSTAVSSVPLVNSKAAGLAGANATAVNLCGPQTLDPAKVTGKMVVCVRGTYDRVAKSAEVKRAGGVAMVLANATAGQSLDADFHSVPTVHVEKAAGDAISAYAAAPGATASIQLGDTTGGAATTLPQIAGFSSRGPAIANDSDVIKPDISAPGVSVLAAVAPPTNSGRDFDLYSGTSMASPHIAGLAAFLLGVHPNWGPMTVKSAMMTTAYDLKQADGSPNQNPFDEGAGHVDPTKFFRPGLVVTSAENDWLSFFEGQGFDFGPEVDPMAASDLNIPSIAQGQVTSSTTIKRTFTGLEPGTWKVAASVPGFDVSSDKSRVVIGKAGDSVQVAFTFTRTTAPLAKFSTGFVSLTGSRVPTVRLPVALRPVSVKAPATVSGTGASGSTDVPITAGFTGSQQVQPSGLAKGFTDSRTIAAGATVDRTVTIGDGTKVARFDLDAANDSADLDLYVYELNDAGTPVAEAGRSATGSADEQVTLTNPTTGKYLVRVDGFAAAPGESSIAYDYADFLVTSTGGLGGLTATPNPVPVTQGQATSFSASWSGLAGGRYLGLFEYDGALAPTFLYVDVP
ncbi:MAG TPA: S8 family serine peptidase [Nocardioides sp.]|nr:S8 family serine peptidase [Nocardioides sp.]